VSIVGTIPKNEGILALFRGLGPNLAGFVPATALKFLLYGNTKTALVGFTGVENGWTHLSAGMIAGVVTSTATNPFWMIKTRLQLDQSWDPSRLSEAHHQLSSSSRRVLQHDAPYHTPCRACSAPRHQATRRGMIDAG
jgi:hypothetical protein